MISATTRRPFALLSRLHLAACVLIALVTFSAAHARDVAWLWTVVWTLGMLGVALTPLRPEVGLGAYVMTLYGTPRYSDLFDSLVATGALHWQVALVAAGTWLWARRESRPFRGRLPLFQLAVSLFTWGGLSALAALRTMAAIDYGARHTPTFFIHAFILMAVASQVMGRRRAATMLIFGLAAGLGIRLLWQEASGIWLEGDIGPLALMTAPLCLLVARDEDSRMVRFLMALGAAVLLAAAAATYNRGTAVAFAAAILVAMWHSRRHVGWLAVSAAVAALGVFWVSQTLYWTRFEDAWAELRGRAVGSVTERLDLWTTGLAVVTDRPLLGVGPSTYPYVTGEYMDREGYVAHNSYVQVAAETGIPGLLLFAALFLAALWTSQRLARAEHEPWVRRAATSIQISLVAYLVAGLFISRHDMVLAYVLVGWLAALTTVPSRVPSSVETGEARGLQTPSADR